MGYPRPADESQPNPAPWFLHLNDLIGGWAVMNVDKRPSACDYLLGEGEIASFCRREDAVLIVRLRNEHSDA